jgi:hypothetical protein
LTQQVFDNLTKEQIKALGIHTDIQRTDSMMASSNIRGYSRLQLLIEILLRLWKILDDDDKAKFESQFIDYKDKSSGQYIYKLKANDLPKEIEKIAQIYHFCKTYIMSKYKDYELNKIFERVYDEHFTEVEEKINVKPSSELNSSCLQSPDDWDATFREKRGEEYRGLSINIVETASLENPLNLIIDVAVNPNNIDDAQVLNERLDSILEKTSDLKELHTDGAYGNAANDFRFKEQGITHIQTAVRGRKCEVDFEIKQISDESFQVNCPHQSAMSQPAGKRYKASFNKGICNNCEHATKCPAVMKKTRRDYYFLYEDYLRNERVRNMLTIPVERRTLRSNVEASVHEFTCRMQKGKLKVRGAFKAEMFAFSNAIGINFGRIFRYIAKNPSLNGFSFLNFVQIIKELLNFSEKFKIIWRSIKISDLVCRIRIFFRNFTPKLKYSF